jgi:hypothetical protein
MDLNFARRKREMAIAAEIEADLLREVTSTTEPPNPGLAVHHFALVCERRNFMPDEGSTGRILGYVTKAVLRKDRELGQMQQRLAATV